MSDRRIICEVAFGFGPFDALTAGDWTELFDADGPRLRQASWQFGRDNELDHFDTGTATVVLRNRDRALDPDNPSSPYAGDLLPYTPVRLRSKRAPITVIAWARLSGEVVLTLDSSQLLPLIGSTVIVDVTDSTFDGTFVVTGYFGHAVVYTQAGADVSNTLGNGTATEVADEFYGFVHGGWQQQLAPIGTGDCVLELVDLLGVMAGYTLPDVFHQAILDYNPVGFWVLDGGGHTDVEQVADLGTGRNDGTLVGEGIQLGDKPVAPGHTPAANFTVTVDATTGEVTTGAVYISRSRVLVAFSTAVAVVTFIARSKATSQWRVLVANTVGSSSSGFMSNHSGFQAHIDTAGKLQFVHLTNGAGIAYITANPVVGRTGLSPVSTGHIAFCGVGAGIALDTDTFATTTTSGGIGSLNGTSIGGGPGTEAVDHFDGWIGTVALFSSLTAGGRTDILNGYSKLDGQRSDQQVAWVLDHLGVPAGLRNLDAGSVYMGPAETQDRDALEFMREVTTTEGGGLFIDHRDGGKVRFTSRYSRFTATRSTTSQATFTDDPASSPDAQIRYTAEGLDVASNGIDGIINQATATWAGGEITIQDATSLAAYGPRPRTIETSATTANAARSAAEWMVARYKDPRSRVRGATASARHTQSRHDKVQELRIGDRVTFRLQPLHTGTATTATLYIDGVSHTAVGVEWETSFRFAQGETFTPFIWGVSEWGNDTYWG